jgi:hypothetical protein
MSFSRRMRYFGLYTRKKISPSLNYVAEKGEGQTEDRSAKGRVQGRVGFFPHALLVVFPSHSSPQLAGQPMFISNCFATFVTLCSSEEVHPAGLLLGLPLNSRWRRYVSPKTSGCLRITRRYNSEDRIRLNRLLSFNRRLE